jgi:TrmH family RNA methyltransferase
MDSGFPLPSRLDADRAISLVNRLRNRTDRERTGLFVGEGLRFLIRSDDYHATVAVLVDDRPLAIPSIAARLERLARAGTPVIRVPARTLERLATVADCQGAIVIARQRWTALDRVRRDGRLCWLGLETLRSPGNLGSIVRTSEAVGAAGVILLGPAIDPYELAAVRASMGSILSQRFARTTPDRLRDWATARDWQLVGTAPDARVSFREIAYDAPSVVLLGDERRGLSMEARAICDQIVHIPIAGPTDSLNVAVAAGVVLYEIYAQRRRV